MVVKETLVVKIQITSLVKQIFILTLQLIEEYIKKYIYEYLV